MGETPETLQALLTAVTADLLAILGRHEASARVVAHYDFNNTYQYVVNREETHVRWLVDALADAGVPMPAAGASLGAPVAPKGTNPGAFKDILTEEARHLGDFVQRWTPRVAAMTHARHRKMLDVVLGESREHQRLFEQAATGFEDVLGRRTKGSPRVGGVLPKRWQA
jgi:hypothetical protein